MGGSLDSIFTCTPTMPNVPVVHPRVIFNDFTTDDTKEWDAKFLKDFVVPEDIP